MTNGDGGSSAEDHMIVIEWDVYMVENEDTVCHIPEHSMREQGHSMEINHDHLD